MLGRDDLVLCSGTLLSGSIEQMVEAAVAGGYRGLTLWPQDVDRARAEGWSMDDLRKLLGDHDLRVMDLDPLLDWTPQATPREGEARYGVPSEEEFYAIADALGATSLNVVQGFGAELDLDRAAEDLAGVCDRAREHGLFITIEFLPWSGIPDVATAWELVRRCGRDNATVLLDTWHFFRGSSTLEQLRAVPGDKVGSLQINDAPAAPAADVLTETMEARLLPGEGDIPLVEIVRTLDEIGCSAPLGVEVFNAAHAEMKPAEVGRRCAEATRRVLAAARSA